MTVRLETAASPSPDCATLIPMPIVRLNRATILLGVVLAFILHAPWITTGLFLIVAPAALFGRRASLIYLIGSRVLRFPAAADGEDPRLMRFNNGLAATFIGLAQLAFVLRLPLLGWILAGLTALASAAALAGFCLGCVLFYQFKLNRSRLFG
jgi:hypothetical protein